MAMLIDQLINDFTSRFGDKAPIEPSQLKVWLSSLIQKLDLVSREEFEAQTRILERTQERVIALEQTLSNLEKSTLIDK